jgi:hypothetical protein
MDKLEKKFKGKPSKTKAGFLIWLIAAFGIQTVVLLAGAYWIAHGAARG